MRIYAKVGLMSMSTLILSAATIMFFNSTISTDQIANVSNTLEMAAMTLMPYMISAAVAAITAISITTLLPLLRVYRSIQPLQERLRLMAAGDLASKVTGIDNSPQLRSVLNDLNNTITTLGNDIAQWKLINRQQWNILQSIRQTATSDNNAQVLLFVEQMEQNWGKIAEIEERLLT